MKMGKFTFISLALIGILTAYLLNEPVPSGISEPGKYRRHTTTLRFMKLLISISHLAHRNEPYESYFITTLQKLEDYFTPTPAAEVPGSNIRSKVIDLNGVIARLYEPIQKEDGEQPAFIYFHGGGMCLGSADSSDAVTRRIAEDLDTVVVSVDYRLAPEYPFPIGFEDSLKATRYFIEHADEFGVDRHRIVMGGNSAGGLLTAAISQSVHDDPDLPDIKLQVLIYPWLQEIDLNTPSYQKYTHDFGDNGFLPLSFMATFLSLLNTGKAEADVMKNLYKNNFTSSKFKTTAVEYSYVDHNKLPENFRDPRYYKTRNDPRTGNDALWARLSSNLLDPRSAPLMRRDMSGLPPAYIITCGFDPLRDDGVFYKLRLEEAGVPVTWVHYEEGFHGILFSKEFKLFGQVMQGITAHIKADCLTWLCLKIIS